MNTELFDYLKNNITEAQVEQLGLNIVVIKGNDIVTVYSYGSFIVLGYFEKRYPLGTASNDKVLDKINRILNMGGAR